MQEVTDTGRWPAAKVEMWSVADLHAYERNARTHPPEQIEQIAGSMRRFGFTIPILAADDGTIIAGHGRLEAARLIGLSEVPVMVAEGWTDEQRRAYTIADNRLAETSEWDAETLRFEIDDLGLRDDLDLLSDIGFTALDLNDLFGAAMAGEAGPRDQAEARASLADRFGAAPFSVLNAREGWWQDRKRQWLALGIRSEVGRGDNLLGFSETLQEPDPAKRKRMKNGKRPAAAFGQDLMRGEGREATIAKQAGGLLMKAASAHPRYYEQKRAAEERLGRDLSNEEFERDHWTPPPDSPASTGTSIFDPVLTELCYRWFCPPGGQILDPFSGGSVRGVVASVLGRRYTGIDLRAEQVEANREQGAAICGDPAPEWHAGDSLDIEALIAPDLTADFLFSCPPYADLEVYSDQPGDISAMDWPAFRAAYGEIIKRSAARLADNRFAAFVVGEVRGKEAGGAYRGFVPETIAAFEAAGLRFYNEVILLTPAGSLPIRMAKQFEASRKVGKTHQNVLIFVKGDPKKATAACGEIALDDIGGVDPFADDAGFDDA